MNQGNRSVWSWILGGTVALGLFVFLLTTISIEGDSKTKTQGSLISNPTTTKGIFDNLIGQTAPDFSLEDYSGKKHTLKDHLGQKVVLFFNEGIMCYPACWSQVASLGQDSRFQGEIVALNIVIDSPTSWSKAISKMPSLEKATVLFDTNRQISQIYGVMTLPSSMHRGSYPGHTYVVIDRSGVIRYTLDDPRMAIQNDRIVEELAKIN